MSQGSLDLWAAAKIIGRECSTVNKDYLICKKEKGENPTVCASQGDLVATCTDNTMKTIKTNYPKEFDAFKKCLDYADYRYDECRKTEKALFDCWNNKTENNLTN